MILLGLLLGLDGGASPLSGPGFMRPLQPQDMDPRLVRGLEVLNSNKPDEALALFQSALADDPESARLQGLVGIAHLHLNHCETGWEWLQKVREKKNFRSASADKLGACWARRGNYAEAVYWQEESILLEPNRAVGWALLALYNMRLGDEIAMEAALREAKLLDENLLRAAMVRAMVALSSGDIDGVDEQLAVIETMDWPAELVGASLEARLELDLGNLARAAQLAASAKVGPNRIGALALEAEANRRAGHIEEAAWLLAQHDLTDSVAPDVQLVQMRVLVDQGELQAAQQVLEPLHEGDPWDAEIIAGAWYLARARGDQPLAAELAERYGRVQASPLRRLGDLVPPQ